MAGYRVCIRWMHSFTDKRPRCPEIRGEKAAKFSLFPFGILLIGLAIVNTPLPGRRRKSWTTYFLSLLDSLGSKSLRDRKVILHRSRRCLSIQAPSCVRFFCLNCKLFNLLLLFPPFTIPSLSPVSSIRKNFWQWDEFRCPLTTITRLVGS